MKIFQHTRKTIILAGALLATSAAHGQLAVGLLNYWDFEGDAADSAVDYPGQAGSSINDGTINGTVTFTTSKDPGFGQAGNFPGITGSNITIEDPTTGTDDIDRTGADLSISIWFQAASWTTGWQAILAHGESQDYRIARRGTNSPTQFAAVVGTSDMLTPTTYGTPPDTDGLWHHIVVTGINGGEGKFYVDGVLERSSTGLADPTVSIASNTTRLCIGCNPVNGREFHGLIDEVAMWNRELTPAEVSAIYDAGVAGEALSTLLISGDDDNDGLPNVWEELYGLDPNDDGSIDIDNGPDGDPDMDGSPNIDELNNNTFPDDNDSDDDTLLDGVETNNGANSWVSATDTGTDPLKKDTDGDGLDDNVEDNGGTYNSPTMTGTNPTLADTDSDTMPDGYEVTNLLDPNVDDGALDPDSDNLSNLAEFGFGTDPQDLDSDDDFANDDVEQTNGTNPLINDSDRDGLLDGHETNNGENSYVDATNTGSNPLLGDTDGDGTSDGREVLLNRNPTVADGSPVQSLEDGLLAYWNFDNTLDDVAHALGLGDSAVADNGTFTAGAGGTVGYSTDVQALFGSNALAISGGQTAGWVTVPSSLDTRRQAENSVSVSAWVKAAVWNVSWQAIIAHGEGDNWRLARHNNLNSAAWVGGGADIFGAGNITAGDGLWHHVVGVADPDTLVTTLYIDGVSVATGTVRGIVDKRNDTEAFPNLFIGANPQGGNRAWNGEIDDVAIWGRPLTAEEVTQIYDGGVLGDSLENLLGGSGPPVISDISFTPGVGIGGNGQITMTFSSRLNSIWAIYGSNNLNDGFPLEIQDEVIGGDGTTTVTFDNPSPSSSKLFFRIEPPRP